MSTSLTPLTPALSSLPRLVQFELLPVTLALPVGSPPLSQTCISMPGVISLPICTISGRAPPAMSLVIESLV